MIDELSDVASRSLGDEKMQAQAQLTSIQTLQALLEHPATVQRSVDFVTAVCEKEQTRQVHRLRARAAAEAGVLAREADAALDLESKERAFEEARRFVRGRLQNDRPDGQRLGMRAPERLARAALGAPREDRLRAAAPFAVASPAVCADAHRERNERWGSGEVSPLMGGGYTAARCSRCGFLCASGCV